MPSSSGIRAGRAFVEVGMRDKLTAGMKRLEKRFKNFGRSMTAIGAKFVAFGGAGLAAFVPTILAASRLEETMNKFNVVFGSNATSMKAWGDEFANQVGRSKEQTASFLASIQDLFVPLGFDPLEAEEFSKTLTKLTIDVASFNNKLDADVLRDFQAALTGGGETVKKYGVLLNVATTNAELFAMGLDPKAATDQQKVLARMNIIVKATSAAHGDAVRSSGSFANQMKRLRGVIDDTAAEIGDALLPVVTPLITKLSTAAEAVAEWAAEHKPLIAIIFATIGAVTLLGIAMTGVGAAIIVAGSALGIVATLLTAAGTAIGLILTPIGLITVGIGTMAAVMLVKSGSIGKALGFLGKQFGELKGRALEAFGGIRDALAAGDIKQAAKILWLGLKSEWLNGVNFILEQTLGIRDTFIDAIALMAKEWDRFTTGMKDVWETAVLAVAIGLVTIQKESGELSPEEARKIAGLLVKDTAVKSLNREQELAARDAKRAKGTKERKAGLRDELKAFQAAQAAARADLAAAIKKAKVERDFAEALDFLKGLESGEDGASGAIDPSAIATALTASVQRVLEPVSLRSQEGINRVLAAQQGGQGDVNRDILNEQRKMNQKLEAIEENTAQQLGAADLG